MSKNTKIIAIVAILIVIIVLVVYLMKRKQANPQVETTESSKSTTGLSALLGSGILNGLNVNALGV